MSVCPQCGTTCKPVGGFICVGFLCPRCNRLRLPSEAYVIVVGLISLFPAIGIVLFLFDAGYPEAVFGFVACWALSYLVLSYVAYRLTPPKLVVRYFGALVTLDLNDADDIEAASTQKGPQ